MDLNAREWGANAKEEEERGREIKLTLPSQSIPTKGWLVSLSWFGWKRSMRRDQHFHKYLITRRMFVPTRTQTCSANLFA